MKEKNEKKMKESLHILNSREKKEFNQKVSEQWGCEVDKEFVFLLSNKNKLYIADTDIGMIEFNNLRIDNVGLYIATVDEKGVRLTIEGSQLIGPEAKKNVVEITKEELRDWLRGNDIPKQVEERGFIILKCGDDFVGCGKTTERGILNFVPKTRRITSND